MAQPLRYCWSNFVGDTTRVWCQEVGHHTLVWPGEKPASFEFVRDVEAGMAGGVYRLPARMAVLLWSGSCTASLCGVVLRSVSMPIMSSRRKRRSRRGPTRHDLRTPRLLHLRAVLMCMWSIRATSLVVSRFPLRLRVLINITPPSFKCPIDITGYLSQLRHASPKGAKSNSYLLPCRGGKVDICWPAIRITVVTSMVVYSR
jgi:hypothetical protein